MVKSSSIVRLLNLFTTFYRYPIYAKGTWNIDEKNNKKNSTLKKYQQVKREREKIVLSWETTESQSRWTIAAMVKNRKERIKSKIEYSYLIISYYYLFNIFLFVSFHFSTFFFLHCNLRVCRVVLNLLGYSSCIFFSYLWIHFILIKVFFSSLLFISKIFFWFFFLTS